MLPKLEFWTLSAEIDEYLTRGDGITQTGLLRLLHQCQAVARDLWTDEANATFALEARDKQIAALQAELERLNAHISYLHGIEASRAALQDLNNRQDSFDIDPNNKD